MKWAWLLVILFSVSASAQYLDTQLIDAVGILVNNATLPPQLSIGGGAKANFSMYIPPGSDVQGVTVDSNNLFFKYGMEALLTEQILQAQSSGVSSAQVNVPLPPGDGDVAISVNYVGENLDNKNADFKTHLTVEGDDKLLGFFVGLLPADAVTDLVGELGVIRILPLDDKLSYRDLSKDDIEKLGISVKDFYDAKKKLAQNLTGAGLPQIEEIAEKEQTYNLKDQKEVFEKYKDELKGKISPDVIVTTHVYKIKKGDKEITKSKIHISVPAAEPLSKVSVVAIIPKEIAKSAKMIEFSEPPTILQDDPVVKWAFKNIPQNQHKDYTLTVDGDAQNFDTIAVAAAKKPSWLARFIAYIVKMFQK